MAGSKIAGEGVSGIEGKVGGAVSTRSSGWHVPRWLVYSGLGLAAVAAAVYVGVRLVTAVPEAMPDQRPIPTVVATPYVPPTPVVSLYQRQALEQIALIGQKEPGLAGLLSNEVLAGEDNLTQSYGLDQLEKIRTFVSEGNYTLDTLVSGTNQTTLLALSKNEFRRNVGLQIIKTSIPVIAEFLGVKYEKPLLLIDLDSTKETTGGGGEINISLTEWQLRSITHETGHEVYETLTHGLTADWLTEGIAELAGIYAASRLPEVMPELASLMASPQWKGKDKTIPDFEKWYKNTVKIIDDPTHNPSREVAPMTKGFVFLYEFRQLVGQEVFAEAMGSLYDAKVVRGAVNRNRRFTTKDIEAVLEQHVPADKLPAFEQLYRQRVYGVQETKP